MSNAPGQALLASMLILHGIAVHATPQSRSDGAALHASEPVTVTVSARPLVETFQAYGQIQPIAVTPVRAVEAGVVSRLVLPGQRVTAGEVLAVLGGVQAQSLLAQRRGALRAAAIQLAADRRKLAAELVTRQAVAADEAAYDAARGKLQVVLQTLTLRAPAGGQVLAIDATNGEQVAPGQLILALQAARPWLSATYYGAEALAIRPGMTGTFQPVSGGAIPVRVRTVSAALAPDGGEQVGLLPALPAGQVPAAQTESWRSGQWGTVTLFGATRQMVAVPTRVLILDRAHWWVLVRTPRGDRPQEVVPGPTRGGMTFVSKGLTAGEQVVVQNAYLEFHRGIAQRYTPPD